MRLLAQRNTGTYAIELVDYGSTGEEYALRVTYLGEWASGDTVPLHPLALDDVLTDELGDDWGEPEALDEADAIAVEWFEAIRADHDVINCLADNGYDRYAGR